jgi:Cysteine-rich CWC
MNEPNVPVDPLRCPLCGNANECGMLKAAEKCWCFTAIIPEDVLARVPEEARNVACVCAICAKQEKNT